MKARWLFFILFLISATTCLGQSPWPPVYEIKVDSTVDKLDTAYWQMLEDKDAKLTLADIVRPDISKKFHADNSHLTGVGFSGVRAYWLRFRLKNSTGKDIKLVFRNFPRVSRMDLYVFRSTGKYDHKTTGYIVANEKRDTFRTKESVKLNLAAGEEVIVYKRMMLGRGDFGKLMEIGYRNYEDYLYRNYFSAPYYESDTRASFIAGLLLFGFFLNLFFFWVNRERVYFIYAMLLLLEGVWYLSVETWFVFRNITTDIQMFDLIVTYNLFFFTVTHFVRYFLKTYRYYPRWDRLLIVLNLAVIAVSTIRLYTDSITPFSWRGIPSAIQSSFFILLNFCLLFSFFLPKKEKDSFTTLSIIAAVPTFAIWSVVYGLDNIYDFLSIRYGIVRPDVLTWLDNNSYVIEMFCISWFSILFTWILLQRYALLRKQLTQQALEREREKTEMMLQQQDLLEKKVEERTSELTQSIEELKTTQQQLIQSEKMASLGELTAGIAHEIQNPLNFVNNFSEVNKELIAEMNQHLAEGNLEEAKQVARDIASNEEKITEHGKRADGIVKSMLQHSRTSSGNKEPTDINELADEYLRLAYHGLRAKDKTFNAKFETDLDPSIGVINVVSQDIGRVLLNLINNAFYAVTEKRNQLQADDAKTNFDPTVTVVTKNMGDRVVITVKDNGNGIPQRTLDKIFLPFFTTKPTGEGTGLGLSMSYDIVTKGHGGEIKVETKAGEGTSFLIILPYNQ